LAFPTFGYWFKQVVVVVALITQAAVVQVVK
jgi:hypothetical protein